MFNPDHEYLSQLSQLVSGDQQQPMLSPAVMPVNIRGPQPFNPGTPGLTEDQIEDQEDAALISAIGGALSGGIGATGQANQTGAYAQGGSLGSKPAPATGATAAPAATPAVAASTYNQPPTDNFGKPVVSARPSYMLQDPAIHDSNAYTGLSEQNRRVGNSTPDYLNSQYYGQAEQNQSLKSSLYKNMPYIYDPSAPQIDPEKAMNKEPHRYDPSKKIDPKDALMPMGFTSPTQPTGESTVRHPQLDALYRQYYGQVGLSGRPREIGY